MERASGARVGDGRTLMAGAERPLKRSYKPWLNGCYKVWLSAAFQEPTTGAPLVDLCGVDWTNRK